MVLYSKVLSDSNARMRFNFVKIWSTCLAGTFFLCAISMKNMWIIFGCLLISSFSFPEEAGRNYLIHCLIVQKDSKLIISGKTNVNSFHCVIPNYFGSDTLVLQEGGKNKKPVFIKGSVALQASLFDCGLQMMTHDLMNTIKAKEYPNIVITFKSFERLPKYNLKEEKFKGVITISLAGTSKQFDVKCAIEAKPSGLIYLSGGRQFLFSDFNLEPPQKMMGMIKTQEELDVNFNLVLRLDTDR